MTLERAFIRQVVWRSVLKSMPAGLIFVSLLSACARYPNEHPTTASAAPAVSAISAASTSYVQSTASAELFEVQAGQLALQRASNSQVKILARDLVNDHSQLNGELAHAAQSSGMMFPIGTLLPQHSALLGQLQAARPEEFDTSYRDVVIRSHMRALDEHQRYASTGDQAALRNFAQAAMPIVQMRLNQAQSIVIAPPYYRPPGHRRAGERG